MKKSVKLIICILAVLLVCGSTYMIWAYNNPECILAKGTPVGNNDSNTSFYCENYMIAFSARKPFENLPKSFSEKLDICGDKMLEKQSELHEKYDAPADIKVSCKIDGEKTVITYSGTATDKSSGKTVDVNEEIVFDFILTKNIQNATA